MSVPSPARDLQAVTLSSTSIMVTWQPPAQTSGNILHYNLSYYEAGETQEHTIEVSGF